MPSAALPAVLTSLIEAHWTVIVASSSLLPVASAGSFDAETVAVFGRVPHASASVGPLRVTVKGSAFSASVPTWQVRTPSTMEQLSLSSVQAMPAGNGVGDHDVVRRARALVPGGDRVGRGLARKDRAVGGGLADRDVRALDHERRVVRVGATLVGQAGEVGDGGAARGGRAADDADLDARARRPGWPGRTSGRRCRWTRRRSCSRRRSTRLIPAVTGSGSLTVTP